MIYTIKNDSLKVEINSRGGEIWSIVKDGTEYLWQGDAKYWGDRAFNLFPYIARLTDGKYTVDGQTYSLTIHGFVNYTELNVLEQSEDSIVLGITQTAETLEKYPYDFHYSVAYTLKGDKLEVKFAVSNDNDKTMYFGVGGHPGFNVPLEEGLGFEDYYLEFDTDEEPVRVGFSKTCFLNGQDKPFALAEGNRIPMAHNMFDNDAIVLTAMSKGITLKSDKSAKSVHVEYPEMDYLGIWHMPFTDAPYVCIEPWTSLPSRQDVVEDLATQPSLVSLPARESYENTWTIQIQ